MTKKRRKSLDLGDLFDTPFDALDRGLEALDDGLEYLDGKMDDLLGDPDVTLEESMAKLDRKMKELDRRLSNPKRYKHKLEFKHGRSKVTVNFNSPDDIQIKTSGDLDDGLMKEIHRRVRDEMEVKSTWKRTKEALPKRERVSIEPEAFHTMELRPHSQPWLWTRNWRGERKAPLEIGSNPRVSVSVGGLFGRKYTVEVDGQTLYFVKLEELMERYWARDHLDILIESWTEEERGIILQVLQMLKTSGIAETHHEEIQKRLS